MIAIVNPFTLRPWPACVSLTFCGKNGFAMRRRSLLPDFYSGAHAAVAGMSLLTRDARHYASYFPGVVLVSP